MRPWQRVYMSSTDVFNSSAKKVKRKSIVRLVTDTFQHHLVSPPYKCFQSSNHVFEGKLKELLKTGKDITVHKTAIEEADMRKFYESGVLSKNDPVSLQRKVFLKIPPKLMLREIVMS